MRRQSYCFPFAAWFTPIATLGVLLWAPICPLSTAVSVHYPTPTWAALGAATWVTRYGRWLLAPWVQLLRQLWQTGLLRATQVRPCHVPPAALESVWPTAARVTHYPVRPVYEMLTALLLHGAIIVGFIGVYGRWLDEEIVADVCLLGLLVELLVASGLGQYLQATDMVMYLQGGAAAAQWAVPTISLALCFDELSAYFTSILTFALILCFFFLVEYFEFDSNALAIIFLSALFSQTALLYFAAYDLCLLVLLWEVISLISFLLVQHWAARLGSFKAGLKVFVVSQAGDLPFFLFIFLLLARVGSADLAEVLGLLPLLAFDYVVVGVGSTVCLLHSPTLLALLLQTAVLLKAAQWFFYPWLLDAMEAPVPISAQLHSSTLVVIGFYLFFRLQVLFDLAPLSKQIFVGVGFLTSVGASVLGFYQEDGKKLLACSTAGQLGYVLVALGLELYVEALYLLLFCCCNKALTFVWFGVFMRRFAGLSDFRYVAGQGLAWREHAGLLFAVANFTVFPGAFCWHVKGLIGHGDLPWRGGLGATLGLGVLQMTWFLSSLYLGVLYLTLFFGPRVQRGGAPAALPRQVALVRVGRWLGSQREVGVAAVGFYTLLGLAGVTLVWYGGLGGLLFTDLLWAEAWGGLATACSYY